MNREFLITAGQLLYGGRWQTETAEALGVTDRTMRRWVSGESNIPSPRKKELVMLLNNRLADIENFLEANQMRTQDEIFNQMQALIPADLWAEYNHLSFAEMANVPELEQWSAELEQAETEWYEAEK